MPELLSLYHKLPAPLRSLAASIRGYNLRQWRYGADTEQLVQESLAREAWSEDQWKGWQEERLAKLLQHAAGRVPYYRDQWALRRRNGDRAAFDLLENWPVLKKTALRESPHLFLSADSAPRRMYVEHTSGTTGTPLKIWQSREVLHQWYALFEARIRRWNGVSRRDRWGILGGQLIVPFSTNKPPFWVWNHAFQQLYLSTYHLNPENIAAYVKAIGDHKVKYLLGYASSLSILAEFVLEKQLEFPPLSVAISNAEPLYDFQRKLISQAFGCAVKNTYGMSEIAGGASECKEGTLHIWPDAGALEIMDDQIDERLPIGSSGRIICTGLINDGMPLIRYEVGDRGSLQAGGCRCGRHMPILGEIEGRMDDIIVTPEGRRIGRLDPVFKIDMPILEAQIIQVQADTLRIRFVPAAGFRHEAQLLLRLKERVGDMQVVLEAVDRIPRGPNGKFRAVISNINRPGKTNKNPTQNTESFDHD